MLQLYTTIDLSVVEADHAVVCYHIVLSHTFCYVFENWKFFHNGGNVTTWIQSG